jgi:hypothetical protein
MIAGVLAYGCLVGYNGPWQLIFSKNHDSALLEPYSITSALIEDLLIRRVVLTTPGPSFICSPLAQVPKPGGKFRCIFNLSHPRGCSVNDYINKEDATLTYMKMAEIYTLVLAAGRHSVILKQDIKDTFCNIPISPTNW